jgi:integrase
MTAPGTNGTGAAPPANLKLCPDCGEWKDKDSGFYKKQHRCIPCQNDASQKYYAQNRERLLANQKVRRARNKPPAPPPNPPVPLSEQHTHIAGYIDEFLKLKEASWRPDTLRSYKSLLTKFVEFIGPCWPVTHVEVMNFLGQTGGSVTIRSYFGHIRTFFNYLEIIGVIEPTKNPATLIQRLKLLPKKDELPPVALSLKEMTMILSYLRRKADEGDFMAFRDLVVIRFAYMTGCRVSEIARLNIEDLRLDEMGAVIRISKSGRWRMVYYNGVMEAELRDYLAKLKVLGYRGETLFVGLMTRHYLKPMTGTGFFQLWQRRLKELGIPHHKFHAIRHTHALHAIDAGIPLYQVKEQLGHENIATTSAYLRGYHTERAHSYRYRQLGKKQPGEGAL